MSFVSKIIGSAERVPLPDLIIRAAIQRLCSRTAQAATRKATLMGSFMSLPKESAPRQTNGLGASGRLRNLTQLTAKKAELKAALLREAVTSRKRPSCLSPIAAAGE